VSPKLMALYRQDEIGLDCLMVLASVDDHQQQEQADYHKHLLHLPEEIM
jgi:ParB family chromosome partitioning protein